MRVFVAMIICAIVVITDFVEKKCNKIWTDLWRFLQAPKKKNEKWMTFSLNLLALIICVIAQFYYGVGLAVRVCLIFTLFFIHSAILTALIRSVEPPNWPFHKFISGLFVGCSCLVTLLIHPPESLFCTANIILGWLNGVIIMKPQHLPVRC